MKKAGFDMIILKGIAPKLCYLWIHDGIIEFRSAEHIRYKDTYETDYIIKKETNDKATVASIGRSGENGVKYASIMTDGRHGRAAGRCGLGAIMGSKKGQSDCCDGKIKDSTAHRTELLQSIRNYMPELKKRTEGLSYFGTPGAVVTNDEWGDIPYRNWRDGSWDGVTKIQGAVLAKNFLTGRFHCGSCPIGCGRVVHSEKYGIVDGAGPEYETLGMFGGCCLIDDIEAIIKLHDLCNRYGMDVISMGQVVAFAMELFD